MRRISALHVLGIETSSRRDETDLREERVETVHFLPFFEEGIVLRYSAEGEFVHEIDLVRLNEVFILIVLIPSAWHGRRNQTHSRSPP